MKDEAKLIEECRSLLLDFHGEPTGEDRMCSVCGDCVVVGVGLDWNDGDMCHPCWQKFGERAMAIVRDIANQEPRP